ncbi:MAG TPA: hypothetical protein VHM30_16910 [Gemmatimonadaceae bacterium]|nr:hypothetical protein [Gemmatimonadaceae bacterium]
MVSAPGLAAALMVTLVAGCAHGPAPAGRQGMAPERAPRATIRFENEAQVQVDVYLVAERREWRLGRVAAGAIAQLPIPDAALTETPGFVRLAVIQGGPLAVQAAYDTRTTYTIAQPAAELLAQRFTFAQRQLGAAQILAMPRARRHQ